MRRIAFTVVLAIGWCGLAQSQPLHLLPRPRSVQTIAGCRGPALTRPTAVTGRVDPGAVELVNERWRALGIPALAAGAAPRNGLRVSVRIAAGGAPQSYRLAVGSDAIAVDAADADGAFYALATLAQLPQRTAHGWALPCVRIADAPALRWRILSDDVSRGPLPTMGYFEERIRTIAAFKMNGYSPYMEHVFIDPHRPLAAPLDGITPRQLGELAAYAARFHVALIPEQQSFAHMHGTLRWETYAPLAETPHGYLLSPANAGGLRYVEELIGDELAVVPHPPFLHIGSDEPAELGVGQSKALVERDGIAAVYAGHVAALAKFVQSRSGARAMIWDDAIEQHPELLSKLPKSLVIVNWHYGDEPSFESYIRRIAGAGFDQMIAPGDQNWNEIYPDIDRALAGERRFLNEGKTAHVLGLFQTVWHDDGETLYEATWYPVLYAASAAWENGDLPPERYALDFPQAFFGVDDAGYARDLADLARARTLLRANGESDSSDYLFWADPLDASVLARVTAKLDLAAIRTVAEDAIAHLRRSPPPPLHANAAAVMALAARRYDALGRGFQIATEARALYDDARAHADGHDDSRLYRDLFETKYLFWERRNTVLALRSLMRHAWAFESRSGHAAAVLERYRIVADRAIGRADAINRATYEDYAQAKRLPSFDAALGLRAGAP
ncbi:MAG: glycoside hydrolase family 20 zincin-like fold domain-containing protein [Vulcanimicrobiaceae bacterium]